MWGWFLWAKNPKLPWSLIYTVWQRGEYLHSPNTLHKVTPLPFLRIFLHQHKSAPIDSSQLSDSLSFKWISVNFTQDICTRYTESYVATLQNMNPWVLTIQISFISTWLLSLGDIVHGRGTRISTKKYSWASTEDLWHYLQCLRERSQWCWHC